MNRKTVLYTGLDVTHCKATGHIVHLPLIKIIPYPSSHPAIQKALEHFSDYTHLIITSKSAIGILVQYLPIFGYSLDDWMAKTTIAVGNITANHLRKQKIPVSIIAKEETAEGLVAELIQMDLQNTLFFWPHSAQARSVLPDFFKNQNIPFVECSFYDTQPLIPPSPPRLDAFDEIIFTSPSTIQAFIKIFGYLPSHTVLTPIGPVTRAYLQHLQAHT